MWRLSHGELPIHGEGCKQEDVDRDSISLEQESMCRLESITRNVSKAVTELLKPGRHRRFPSDGGGRGEVGSRGGGGNPGKGCELELQIQIYSV